MFGRGQTAGCTCSRTIRSGASSALNVKHHPGTAAGVYPCVTALPEADILKWLLHPNGQQECLCEIWILNWSRRCDAMPLLQSGGNNRLGK
jgi:hypothetical protein